MPNKAHRGKRKYSPLSKRKRERQPPANNCAGQPLNIHASLTTSSTNKAESRTSNIEPVKTSTTDNYPYVVDELKRIGILTGIILIIMIVLALLFR